MPWWVWLVCLACLVWLVLALWGQLIRDRFIEDPVKARAEAAAVEADKAGEPLPNSVQALGDLDLPPVRPAPVDEANDRGQETLRIGAKRCGLLNEAFQARVVGEGLCEVYLHELARQDGTVLIMASPRYGVRDNGRPVLTILPESAYPVGN